MAGSLRVCQSQGVYRNMIQTGRGGRQKHTRLLRVHFLFAFVFLLLLLSRASVVLLLLPNLVFLLFLLLARLFIVLLDPFAVIVLVLTRAIARVFRIALLGAGHKLGPPARVAAEISHVVEVRSVQLQLALLVGDASEHVRALFDHRRGRPVRPWTKKRDQTIGRRERGRKGIQRE
jgi:hypothetical protein